MFDETKRDKDAKKPKGVIFIAPTVRLIDKKVLIVKDGGTLLKTIGVLDEIPSISLMAIDALKNLANGVEITDARYIYSNLKKGNIFLVEIMLPVKSLHYFIRSKGFMPVSASTFIDSCKDRHLIRNARIFG